MKAKQRASYFGLSELLLAFLATVLVIMLANRYLSAVRFDATENQSYTVSQGTKNILKDVSQPISLKLFYSKKLATQLPGIGVYGDRVADMLKEYQRIAGDKISIEQIDPEPFSEQEDIAVANGLSGVPIDQSGNSFYFGLVGTNSVDGRETIPFFSPERERQLEYDLSQLVYRLSSEQKTKVGILTTLPVQGDPQAAMFGMPSQPWFSLQQLNELHEVDYLDAELDTLEQELSLVLVIHPSTLSRQTLFALDQYALKGGRVIMFVDPYAESSQQPDQLKIQQNSSAAEQSDISALLLNWGIRIDASAVIADLDHALRVQSAASGRAEVVDYPIWFMLNQENMNAEDPVFQQLGEVVLASVGELHPSKDATTEFSALLTTSDNASLISTEVLRFQTDPKEVLKQYSPGESSKTVAARISGKAQTAFPNYQPEPIVDENNEDIQEQTQTEIEQINEGDINIVVFADTDLLRDQFWVQVQNFLGSTIAIPSAGNGQLLANLVDQMSGSPDLISVRNQGSNNRPFTLLEKIRQAADQNFLRKEQELLAELQDTENKLLQLEQAKDSSNSAIVSADQQQEVENFTNKKLTIRKELRQVRHSLQKDIQRVESIVKVVNLALVPLLITLFGLMLLFFKSRRVA